MAIADNLAVLQAQVTKTATFQGTALNSVTGSAPRGYKAEVIVTNYSVGTTGTAATTFTFTVEVSSDNTTFRTLLTAPVLTASTAAATADFNMEFIVPANEPYYRLVETLGGNGTLPTISYQGRVGDARGTGGKY